MIERALRPRLDLCLTEAPPTRQQLAFTMDEYSRTLHTAVYKVCQLDTPETPGMTDLNQRYSDHVRDVSARAVALLAGKQGTQLAVAFFGVWKSFKMYAEFLAWRVFRQLELLDPRRLEKVAYTAFRQALSGAAAARRGSSADRDIALLEAGVRCMAARIGGPPNNAHASSGELRAFEACVAAHDAAARELRRRELALMLALCAKDPPRAELADNGEDGEEVLYVAVRLANAGKKDMVELILKNVAPEGARELDRAVTDLLAVKGLPATVTELLRDFNLSEYAEAFVENGYGNVARLCELIDNVRTPDDPHFTTFLTAVGMTKTGHIARFFSYMKRRADRPWVYPYGRVRN